ncbi:hypothetical protein Tco_1182100 [Tanacetum coccineum]
MRVLTHRLTFNSRMRTPTIFTAKILLLKIMQILRGIEIKAVIWLWIDKLALRCTAVTILSIVPAKFTQDLLRVCGVVKESLKLLKKTEKLQSEKWQHYADMLLLSLDVAGAVGKEQGYKLEWSN